MIKTSKEIDKLIKELIKLDEDSGCLEIKADYTVYGYDDSGAVSGVNAGIKLAMKAIKLNKPIYVCHQPIDTYDYVGYYFVNDLTSIKALLKITLKKYIEEQEKYAKEQIEQDEKDKENRVKELEAELKKLKRGKK